MKSLLTAVTIVAVLCLASVATPQEKATTTVYPPTPDDQPERDQRLTSVRVFPEQDPELREQYLRILQRRVDDMSNAELKAAISAVEAEAEWQRAEGLLQKAADILAGIYLKHQGTDEAKKAASILTALSQQAITSDRLKGAVSTAPPSQAPASRRQTP